jgi:pimeloyl-ACP methyl ester carboxylesterase
LETADAPFNSPYILEKFQSGHWNFRPNFHRPKPMDKPLDPAIEKIWNGSMQWRKHLLGTWNWKRPLKSIAFIYGCLFIVTFLFAEQLMFFPPPPGYQDGPEILKLQSRSGERIAAVHLAARPGLPTLLFTHGNAEDLGDVMSLAEAWNDAGLGVLAYDFPGYGLSSGNPREATCEAAIDAAWDYLTKNAGIPGNRIIVVGRSVGSGPSVWLAERKNPAGLILISPFTSAFSVRLPVPLFPRDRFPNLKRMPRVDCPLLVIHGEDDRLIPPLHGRRLLAASPANDKTYLGIQGAGHNDLFEQGETQIQAAILNFAHRTSGGE